ncbi:alpha/beta hydrolase fold domain-containing protein [Escherichia coli]
MYLRGIERRHPEASPLGAMIPMACHAHIITAEYDPLCDEGEALYHRINSARCNRPADATLALSTDSWLVVSARPRNRRCGILPGERESNLELGPKRF